MSVIPVIAHRGASEDAPEHSLAACRRALADGADALECDVRLTADGHLVCLHDRRVNRTSNGRGAVAKRTLAELEELDFTGEGVLTLERLLRLIAGADRPVGLSVETKHPSRWGGRVEERLLALLDRYPLPGPVRIMSFSAGAVRRVHRAAPARETVYLMRSLLQRHGPVRLPAGCRIAGPGIRLLRRDPGFVARAHAAGYAVHVWTVDEPADVELCVRLCVDAVITNRPRTVRAQLERLA